MRSLMWKLIFCLAIIVSLLNTGCATMDKLMGYEQEPAAPAEQIKQAARYSENAQMGVPTDRQYKRMTRNRMEEESDLGSSAGSTWVMEGQGAYLFAQNKTRREGDILNVKLDEPARKQVETKVSVIKKLLKQLEEQQMQEQQPPIDVRAPASEGAATTAAAPPPPKKEEKKEDKDDGKADLADVQTIPTRIVEKMADGNYRVKGAQPFMIGKREYKVIITGMIRPEDFNDEGVSSVKLLDPQFDVVSIRRNTKNE